MQMNFFRKSSRHPASSMLLESEAQSAIENPSEDEVRKLILSLSVGQTSFASLTNEAGEYVQVAGSRPWCVIEHRKGGPRHERAFQKTPTPKYKDGAKLRTGAGDITLKHDEWFLLKDAVEVFLAFLRREPYPAQVQWRSMNDTLGLT